MTHIFHSVNSSLFFYAEHTGLLIDGLHGAGPYQCFSPMPSAIRKQMINRAGIFGHTDALLFSHAHGDHYDADALYYLCHGAKQPPEVFLFGGLENTIRTEMLHNRIQHLKVGAFDIYTLEAPHQCVSAKDKTLFALHNCSFVICLGNERFFIAADSQLCEEDYEWIEPFGELSVVFCNAYHAAIHDSRKLLEKLNAKRIFIYHLPLEADDIYSYQSMARHAAQAIVMKNGDKPVLLPQMSWLDGLSPNWE